MPIKRRLAAVFAMAAFTVLSTAVHAQAWPERAIRLVVPFPPGGLIDNMARLVAPRLAQELGQPVVIDNKPGAGGNLGAAEAARAAPDGYTLLMASPPLTISPALYAKLPYKPEQIAPLALLGRVPNVLMVNPASGINTVAELTAQAKARSSPRARPRLSPWQRWAWSCSSSGRGRSSWRRQRLHKISR